MYMNVYKKVSQKREWSNNISTKIRSDLLRFIKDKDNKNKFWSYKPECVIATLLKVGRLLSMM